MSCGVSKDGDKVRSIVKSMSRLDQKFVFGLGLG